jgi:hypothetical protein
MAEALRHQFGVAAIRARYKAPSERACLNTIVNSVGQLFRFYQGN